MIDVKSEVRTALLANTSLVTALGGDDVYSLLSPDGTVFPYIILQEVDNEGIDYADNTATRAEIKLQIDVFAQSDFTSIVSLIDDTLSPLGYVRYYSTESYEFETRAFRKILRYLVAKELS